jgi:hypothetical protein
MHLQKSVVRSPLTVKIAAKSIEGSLFPDDFQFFTNAFFRLAAQQSAGNEH